MENTNVSAQSHVFKLEVYSSANAVSATYLFNLPGNLRTHSNPTIVARFPTIWIEEVELDADIDVTHCCQSSSSPALPVANFVSNLVTTAY